jgi:hypothetical protein
MCSVEVGSLKNSRLRPAETTAPVNKPVCQPFKESDMGTKLIKLSDGTMVEVESAPDEPTLISGGFAENVDNTIDKIKPFILNACRPITQAWKELSNEVKIEQAEIELGVSFEGEGNLFITRSKAGANFVVKITIKPRE